MSMFDIVWAAPHVQINKILNILLRLTDRSARVVVRGSFVNTVRVNIEITRQIQCELYELERLDAARR